MYREDWGLEDPTGKGDDAFLRTMRAIQQRVIGLRARIVAGEFDRERLALNLKALGDPNRLRIVELLWDGEEQCACNLLSELEISQPTLSHHMAALRDAGIVRALQGRAVGCTTSSTTMSSMQSPRCSDRASPTAHGRIQRSRQRVQTSTSRTADACRAGMGTNHLAPAGKAMDRRLLPCYTHPRPPDGFGPHARAPPLRDKATMRF
ncbi:MAG: metalloregulator ArsR/SmtB family transcription factor [Collinsella sp.]